MICELPPETLRRRRENLSAARVERRKELLLSRRVKLRREYRSH